MAGLAIVIGIAVATWVVQSIRNPLNNAQAAAQRIAARNDLTVAMPRGVDDEIGRTISAFGKVISGMRELILEVRQDGRRVAESASEMGTISEHVALASSMQAQASASVAAAVEQLTNSIAIVADNADDVKNAATQASNRAGEGQAFGWAYRRRNWPHCRSARCCERSHCRA